MTIILHDKAAAAAAVKTVQQAAKERDMKVKKMAASKKAEMRKLEEQLEALRMQEPPVPETPPAADELPLEEPPEEKKLAPKQATLDFF